MAGRAAGRVRTYSFFAKRISNVTEVRYNREVSYSTARSFSIRSNRPELILHRYLRHANPGYLPRGRNPEFLFLGSRKFHLLHLLAM
jgi:hypothetical protein